MASHFYTKQRAGTRKTSEEEEEEEYDRSAGGYFRNLDRVHQE